MQDANKITPADHEKIAAYRTKVQAKRLRLIEPEIAARRAVIERQQAEPMTEAAFEALTKEVLDEEMDRDLLRIEEHVARTPNRVREFTRIRMLQQRGHVELPDPVEE